jgi:hypothetical protein
MYVHKSTICRMGNCAALYQLVHHVKPPMDISIYNGIIVSRIQDKDIVNVSLADNLLKIFVL